MSDSVDIQNDNGTLKLTLHGEVRADCVPGMRDAILVAIANEDPQQLEVDLADVPFMDSSGLAILVEARRKMGKKPMAVLSPAKPVREMIGILRLDSLFDVQEAKA